jgi:hypothetical protein
LPVAGAPAVPDARLSARCWRTQRPAQRQLLPRFLYESDEDAAWGDPRPETGGQRPWLCENTLVDVILAIRFPRELRGASMKRFVAGVDREQSTLLPECLDDFIDESNPVRVIDAFVDVLDLAELGFDGVEPAATGRPSYHPHSLSLLLALLFFPENFALLGIENIDGSVIFNRNLTTIYKTEVDCIIFKSDS